MLTIVGAGVNALYGGDHAFKGIPLFDPIRCGVYDHASHNTLEGTTKLELHDSHAHFFSEASKAPLSRKYQHTLTLDIWNSLLASIKMLDGRHKLDAQAEIAFQKDSSIYWTAAQMKDYALRSVDLLEPYIDASDPKWDCWVKHCMMIMHMNKERYKLPNEIFDLHYAVLNHYSTFVEVYPECEIPKHHWTSAHIKDDVIWTGRPSETSCIKMEHTRQRFKRVRVALTKAPLPTLSLFV